MISLLLGSTTKREKKYCMKLLKEVVADLESGDSDSDSDSE